MRTSRFLCTLIAGTLAGSLSPALAAAPARAPQAHAQALAVLEGLRPALGLEPAHTFQVRASAPDPALGGEVVRVEQYFQGVRVLHGEAVLHLRDGRLRTLTDRFQRRFAVDTRPGLTPSEALAVAAADLAPRGPFAYPPTAELVVARLKAGPGRPLRDALLYRVHLVLLNGTAETAAADYLVDAHTGAVVRRWDSLKTLDDFGPGRSQYSGKVDLNVTATKDGFELRDKTRGKGAGNTVVDLEHGFGGKDKVYHSTTNQWGDGANYRGGSTTSANGQTAAVDAAYGLQWTWDYYQNIHRHQGIDGEGRSTTLRVHYDKDYDNAFWDDDCFCMTFGDGSKFKSLEPMDVIGHEVSHGVCAATANLDYYGESGGLNEANSDINGTMVEFYAHSADPDKIGDAGGNWTMGEQLATKAHPKPIRYLYKPSLDGKSPDEWNPDLDMLNVHRSSGPMNRCFYFLSQGAAKKKSSCSYTSNLPEGMDGLGNDRAAHIWFRALTNYLTSGSNYEDARSGCIKAAIDLFGEDSPEEQAVWNAFHGIAVGDAYSAKVR